jgi:MFS family permease
VGALLNILLGKWTDKLDKAKLLYLATAIFALGLLGMYFSHFDSKIATLLVFGGFGFLMITGFILTSALSGALIRDYTPEKDAGKMQGIRMIFSVLLPMIFGPMIGNAINKAANIPLVDAGADAMTTQYIPAPEIFLAGAIAAALLFAVIPFLVKLRKQSKAKTIE